MNAGKGYFRQLRAADFARELERERLERYFGALRGGTGPTLFEIQRLVERLTERHYPDEAIRAGRAYLVSRGVELVWRHA